MNNIKNGFDYSLHSRNEAIASSFAGKIGPTTTKTGTTIVGLCYKDGVILGADTRATEGPIVADKNCEKIHYIADNMYCCGAGTAADTEFTTNLISSKCSLHLLNSRKEVPLASAMTMLKQYLFRHQGHIGAALILGGMDISGPHLYSIHPHGSVDQLPFVTMGSGSLAAMSIFEEGWRIGMEKEEALNLVVRAIRAGIFNDLGSGSNVDCVILSKNPENDPSFGSEPVVEVLRNLQTPNERPMPKQKSYCPLPGTTPILLSTLTPLNNLVDVEIVSGMEIS